MVGPMDCVATCLKTRERFSFVIKSLGLHNSFVIVGASAVLTGLILLFKIFLRTLGQSLGWVRLISW